MSHPPMSSDLQARSAMPLPLTAPPRSLAAIANDRDAVVRLLAQISRIRSSVHGTFELVAAKCEQPQAGPSEPLSVTLRARKRQLEERIREARVLWSAVPLLAAPAPALHPYASSSTSSSSSSSEVLPSPVDTALDAVRSRFPAFRADVRFDANGRPVTAYLAWPPVFVATLEFDSALASKEWRMKMSSSDNGVHGPDSATDSSHAANDARRPTLSHALSRPRVVDVAIAAFHSARDSLDGKHRHENHHLNHSHVDGGGSGGDAQRSHQHLVFRRVTAHAREAALRYFGADCSPKALTEFLLWLDSYRSLFTAACVGCDRLLRIDAFCDPHSADSSTADAPPLLPPTLRLPSSSASSSTSPSTSSSMSSIGSVADGFPAAFDAWHADCAARA